MNKQLNDKYKLWSECNNLMGKSTYRIVNALRHIDPQTADPKQLHVIDQLIRTLEYLEDVKVYQYKLRKQLVAMDRTIRGLKAKVKHDANLEVQMPTDWLRQEFSFDPQLEGLKIKVNHNE